MKKPTLHKYSTRSKAQPHSEPNLTVESTIEELPTTTIDDETPSAEHIITPLLQPFLPPPPGWSQCTRHTILSHKHLIQVSQMAVYNFLGNAIGITDPAYIPTKFMAQRKPPYTHEETLQYCNAVTHPITGETITKYKTLAKYPATKDIWEEAFCIELSRLAQGYLHEKGTSTINFLTHYQIKFIPANRTVTYARIVVDYRPQKADPNSVCITTGGNLITYPNELTTRTAELTTTKILWNSVISTPGARYMCVDIKKYVSCHTHGQKRIYENTHLSYSKRIPRCVQPPIQNT